MKYYPNLSKLLVILFLLPGLFSCEKLEELQRLTNAKASKIGKAHDKKDKDRSEDPCGEPIIVRLVSRDNLEYSPGRLLVSNDADMLTVEVESTEGNLNIDMIYLHVGPLDGVPMDGDGTYPAFWEFAHQYSDVPVSSYAFQIPLSELDECFMVLAQARFNDGQDNVTITWSQGVNPEWTAGPFYTHYCVEFCNADATGTNDDDDDDD